MHINITTLGEQEKHKVSTLPEAKGSLLTLDMKLEHLLTLCVAVLHSAVQLQSLLSLTAGEFI